jgi:hypothetical protein
MLWVWVALLCLPLLVAFVFETIPAIRAQGRKKWLINFDKPLQPGYFSLAPREDEATFKRADGKHDEILRWLQRRPAPILYLTGLSGSGKSSLLCAWVLPKLQRDGTQIMRLRGYQDPIAFLDQQLRKPGVIWDRRVPDAADIRSLLEKASAYLHPRRLLLVVDQFEEFVILQDPARQERFERLLNSLQQHPIPDLTVLLVFRSDYIGLIERFGLGPLTQDANWREIPQFTETAARDFIRDSGLQVGNDLMQDVLREAAEVEQTKGLIRPVTVNLCGLVMGRFATGLPRGYRPGELIRSFLCESVALPAVRDIAPQILPQFITKYRTNCPCTVTDLAESTGLDPSAIRGCLRVLGQSERAVVRPLDAEQQTWEISHDFLIPVLETIVSPWSVSHWRRVRPWLPWAAAVVVVASLVAMQVLKWPPHNDSNSQVAEKELASAGLILKDIASGKSKGGPQFNAETVSKLFPLAPISNINRNTPFIIDALQQVHVEDRLMTLIAFAVIRAEGESFEPFSEAMSNFNTSPSGHPFDKYDFRSDLGNHGPPDGMRFRGRGYVQLTGRTNYQIFGPLLGLGDSLVQNPDLENDPKIAAETLAFYLATRQVKIKLAASQGDLAGARRLINGGSNGIVGFSKVFIAYGALLKQR